MNSKQLTVKDSLKNDPEYSELPASKSIPCVKSVETNCNLSLRTIFFAPDRYLAKGTIQLIRIYQKTLSPDHSVLGAQYPFCGCRFYPSCSQYAVIVLEKQGFVVGFVRIVWRILRCNPWGSGGHDFPFEGTSEK